MEEGYEEKEEDERWRKRRRMTRNEEEEEEVIGRTKLLSGTWHPAAAAGTQSPERLHLARTPGGRVGEESARCPMMQCGQLQQGGQTRKLNFHNQTIW